MYDIDEDGSLKPYTAHHLILWACLIFVLYFSCGLGAFVMWLLMRN